MPGFDGMHLVLAGIEDGVRSMSIRQLAGFSESIGLKTTLLFLVKLPGGFQSPISFSPAEVSRIAAFLKEEKVTHLGFYLMTGTFKPVRALVASLRAAGFDGMILAGGIHARLKPEESLMEGAQFAVQGPGEIPLRMILEGADPAKIPGLVWRDPEGNTRVNEIAPDQFLDLDARPFPVWRLNRDKVLLDGRIRTLTERIHRAWATWHGQFYDIQTSIGCMYKCAYCCQVHRGKVMRAGVDRTIREIQHARKNLPFLRGVNLQDDSFFAGPKEWPEEFCDRMPAEVGLPFIARLIPRQVTPERLDRMVKAGLVYVTMGLEGSDRLNKTLYHRNETVAIFLEAAKLVLDRGLILSVDVLRDNPYETEADLREVALTLNQLPRPNWSIVTLSLTPFPGTPLYDRCVADGTLTRFPTDAYDAMLVPSREGAYFTPSFWRKLNTQLLPLVSQDLGAKLIAGGPRNPSAAAMVERLTKWMLRMRRGTHWIRDHLPTFYAVLFRSLRIFSPRKELSRFAPFE